MYYGRPASSAANEGCCLQYLVIVINTEHKMMLDWGHYISSES